MGTYTTNYNLFMPTVGEQGWGTLVNANFETIDTTMKGLDTRLTTCESTDVAYNIRLETLEAGEFETVNVAGTISANTISANSVEGVFGFAITSNVNNAINSSPLPYITSSFSTQSTSYVSQTIPNLFSQFIPGYLISDETVTMTVDMKSRYVNGSTSIPTGYLVVDGEIIVPEMTNQTTTVTIPITTTNIVVYLKNNNGYVPVQVRFSFNKQFYLAKK